ncbi:polyprenyl synthetase family protein [Nocardia brasiliensis]|uniref:polyprenyl synthetase family protein n=1 Tax=Nocardia brasiliensis TaxID=37326 RepID=UPI0037B3DA45
MEGNDMVDASAPTLAARVQRHTVAQFVDGPLREAIAGLEPSLRHMAGYHFGLIDQDSTPARPRDDVLRRRSATFTLLGAGSEPCNWQRALHTAVANQLQGAALFIHDDLVDEDRLRYGRPTIWAAFGVGAAVHLGDALQNLALQVLDRNRPPRRDQLRTAMLTCCARIFAGQTTEMVMEQQRHGNLETALAVYRDKTANSVSYMFSSGASSAGADTARVDAAAQFGFRLGMAAQFHNDLESLYRDGDTQLKDTLSDLRQRKMTAIVAYALGRDDPRTKELTDLYRADTMIDGEQARRIRRLLEETGATQWARDQEREYLTAARALIPKVSDGPNSTGELHKVLELHH